MCSVGGGLASQLGCAIIRALPPLFYIYTKQRLGTALPPRRLHISHWTASYFWTLFFCVCCAIIPKRIEWKQNNCGSHITCAYNTHTTHTLDSIAISQPHTHTHSYQTEWDYTTDIRAKQTITIWFLHYFSTGSSSPASRMISFW